MMKIAVHSLVGSTSESCWAQSQSLVQEKATVIVSLLLKKNNTEGQVDLASMGGALFEKFHEKKEILTGLPSWKEWLNQEADDLTQAEIDVSYLITYFEGGSVWIFGQGQMVAMLYRQGRFAKLGEGESWGLGIEGQLQDSDVLMLGTTASIPIWMSESVVEVLTQGEDDLAAAVAPLMQKQDNPAELAMSLIIASKDSEAASISRPIFGEKVGIAGITIKRMSEAPRKYNLVFGGVVVILIVVMVGVGLVARSRRVALETYETTVSNSARMLAEAESVASSNPERAKILLSQSKETLTTYLLSDPPAAYIRQAQEQLSMVESREQEILRVRGSSLTPTIELGVLSERLSSQTMQTDGEGILYFWDDSAREFVGVSVADLSRINYPVTGGRGVGAFSVSDKVYTGMTSEGVWRGAAEQQIVIPTDETWGSITQVATFGNNIYLLDTGMGEIWKYAATSNGYAERSRWFGARIILDLSKVVDWEVDGDIWLLTSSGKLERYSRGVPVRFELSGFPAERATGGFVDPVAIEIVDDVVYVLERGSKRVVAFDREGLYLEQYVAEEFGLASDMVVYNGRGYVLVDNVVKEWEL